MQFWFLQGLPDLLLKNVADGDGDGDSLFEVPNPAPTYQATRPFHPKPRPRHDLTLHWRGVCILYAARYSVLMIANVDLMMNPEALKDWATKGERRATE